MTANSIDSLATRTPFAGRVLRMAWLPIPLLLATMVALWAADLPTLYPAPWLAMSLSLATLTLACLVIAYLAGRAFLAKGTPAVLLLGCGGLGWGTAILVSAGPLGRDPNVAVTITNLGVWMAAGCFLASGILSVRSRRTTRVPGWWLAPSYLLAAFTIALVTAAAVSGRVPVFFTEGAGGTLVRYVVLASTAVMLVVAALLARWTSQAASSSFGENMTISPSEPSRSCPPVSSTSPDVKREGEPLASW